MDTTKAFIGFNIEGKEILVYKRDDGAYIDLLSKQQRIYPPNDINFATLMPYNKVMKTSKYKSKSSSIKKYKLDRSKMLDIKNIKIGYVCSMYNTIANPLTRDTFELQTLFKTLFIEHFIKYEDIIDSRQYRSTTTIADRYIYNGNLCAKIELKSNLITSKMLEANNRYVEKKKAIELAYKLRNSKQY